MIAARQFPSQGLTGAEISLRTFRDSDAPFVVIGAGDAETQKWLPLPNPYTLDDARWFIQEFVRDAITKGTGVVFALEHNQTFLGCIDVKHVDWLNGICEIGYWTMPGYRGRGYMPQALEMLSRWVLAEQGFSRVEVRVATENFPSQRVAEKAGFIREGIARMAGRVHSGRVDLIIYSRIGSDL